MLDIEFGEHSDIGRVRDTNEDAHGHVAPANPAHARSHGWFFVLADGVGGHDRGEVASRLAVDTVEEGFKRSRPNEPHSELLTKLIQQANLKVYEAGRSAAPGGAQMATTMVACAAAPRPRGCRPRRRFTLLPDPAKPGDGADARPHGGE